MQRLRNARMCRPIPIQPDNEAKLVEDIGISKTDYHRKQRGAVNAYIDRLRSICGCQMPGNIQRYFMHLADLTPLKCILVGIEAYDSAIIPYVGSAVSVDISKVSMIPDSVTVLAQAISLVDPDVKLTDMMVRLGTNQYMAQYGIGFMNLVTNRPRNSVAKFKMTTVFIEWLYDYICIAASYDPTWKLELFAMGIEVHEDLVGVKKSLRSEVLSRLKVYKMRNPVWVSHRSHPELICDLDESDFRRWYNIQSIVSGRIVDLDDMTQGTLPVNQVSYRLYHSDLVLEICTRNVILKLLRYITAV